jgi:hypothetical protein
MEDFRDPDGVGAHWSRRVREGGQGLGGQGTAATSDRRLDAKTFIQSQAIFAFKSRARSRLTPSSTLLESFSFQVPEELGISSVACSRLTTIDRLIRTIERLVVFGVRLEDPIADCVLCRRIDDRPQRRKPSTGAPGTSGSGLVPPRRSQMLKPRSLFHVDRHTCRIDVAGTQVQHVCSIRPSRD